jgi:hypothetical protein
VESLHSKVALPGVRYLSKGEIHGFWSKLGIALAIGGIGVSVALGFAVYIWREIPRWAAFIGFGMGISLCVAALVCFIFIPGIDPSDVALVFVQSDRPGLIILNHSTTSARSAIEPIFDRPNVLSLLKDNDEVFGYMSVSCPECERERVYWVYVKWPKGGWYSEIPEGKSIDTRVMYSALPEIKKDSASALSFIPISSRKPIEVPK